MSYLRCHGAVPNDLTGTFDICRLGGGVSTCFKGVVDWCRCDKANCGKHSKHRVRMHLSDLLEEKMELVSGKIEGRPAAL